MDMMIKTGILNEQMLKGLDGLVKYFPENGSEIYVNIKKNYL